MSLFVPGGHRPFHKPLFSSTFQSFFCLRATRAVPSHTDQGPLQPPALDVQPPEVWGLEGTYEALPGQ